MKFEENNKIWDLYLESPWLYNTSSPTDDVGITIGDVLKYGEQIDTWEGIDVYKSIRHKDSFIFVKNDEIVSFYKWDDSVFDGVYQTRYSWNNPKYKGIFRKIFANYILPKLKQIQSDNMLTDKAFEFWKKMMVEYPNFNYYVVDSGEWKKITEPESINQYKGGFNDDSTFIIST